MSVKLCGSISKVRAVGLSRSVDFIVPIHAMIVLQDILYRLHLQKYSTLPLVGVAQCSRLRRYTA